jgi:hypothetical protein
LLLPAATAQAAIDTIGSDLSSPATTVILRTEDTALVQLAAPGGGSPAVPHSGQVLSVQVRGCSGRNPVQQDPETAIYVQDLHTGGGGAVHVVSSSQKFTLPICGTRGADAGTVSSYAPTDQCVSAGDLVGLVVGGQTPGYPQGTPYFIARPSLGAALGAYSKNGNTVNSSSFTLAPLPDTEVLAQVRIGSGPDSPSRCAGGPTMSADSVQTAPAVTASPDQGGGALPVSCAMPPGDPCTVYLVVTTGRKHRKRLGSVVGTIPGGQSGQLPLRLNHRGRTTLRHRGLLRAALRGKVVAQGTSATVTRKLDVSAG